MATTVPNVANHLPIHSSKSHSIRRRGLITPTFQPVCCSRLEEHGQPKQYQISSGGKDIWKLFEQAQHNILDMNNQRIRAQEELEKVRRENQLLLQMIEGIEIDKRVDSRKVDGGKDKLSTCWKLLLRIDSLVLTGLIGTEEASELRSLAMGTKAGVESFISLLEKNDTELLAELRHLSEQSKKNGFHIIHICTEMDPVVSVGSLASYVTGLSRALQRKSHLVEVILPKYKSLDLSVVQGLREIQAEFFSYFDGCLQGNKILTGVVNGIGVTFIQPLHHSSYFEREKVYGYPDDFERKAS